MELNHENIIRLSNYLRGAQRIREPKTKIEPVKILNLSQENFISCSKCKEIARFPIFFPCGHLLCNFCYFSNFNSDVRHREDKFFTKCPECNFEVLPEQVQSYPAMNHVNPGMMATKFYSNLLVRCENAGCDEVLQFKSLTKHELFECSRRVVKCPAQNCPITGVPTTLYAHSANCPLNGIWCRNCNEMFSIVVRSHSCGLFLQRNLLLGKHFGRKDLYFSRSNALPHGCVWLPVLPAWESPDDFAIKTIRATVQKNRGLYLLNLPHLVPDADRPGNQEPSTATAELRISTTALAGSSASELSPILSTDDEIIAHS